MAITVPHASAATEAASPPIASVTTAASFTSTTGNLLIGGCVGDSVSGEGTTPLSDGGTNTWTGNKSTNQGSDPTFVNICFAKNITGKAGQALTYTLNAAGYPSACLIEVAGCDTTSPNDVAPTYTFTSNTSAVVNSSIITPAAGDHILIVLGTSAASTGVNQSVANIGTQSPTWTVIKNDASTSMSMLMAYTIVTASGSGTYGVAYAHGTQATDTYVGIAAFKIAAGGGTTYTLSGSTTQAQSLTLPKQVRPTRSLAQAQTLSLIRRPALVRALTQAQSLVVAQRAALTRALTQTQALTIVPQKVFLRTVTATQAQTLALSTVLHGTFHLVVSATQGQTLALSTAVHHTYTQVVSAIQAQVVSLLSNFIPAPISPPPVPVAVPSSAPSIGTAVSNYLDWPTLIVTSNDAPPPEGTAIGGPS